MEQVRFNAFGGSAEFKARLLREVEKHRKADALAQSSYGMLDADGKWKGCAVACSLRSLERMDRPKGSRAKSTRVEYSDHGELASRLGIPRVLARLQDRLFEGQTPERAQEWPRRFYEAIRPGADLSPVWPRFAAWLLTVERPSDSGRAVASLFERRLNGDEPSRDEWRSAADAAWEKRRGYWAAAEAAEAAAEAAEAAAEAAEAAAEAAEAEAEAEAEAAAAEAAAEAEAEAAEAAEAEAAEAEAAEAEAAEAAAEAEMAAAAAGYAVRRAARHACNERMADKLIELMAACHGSEA